MYKEKKMKKLLVTLLLGAGFVTTASALDGTENLLNQCLLDASSITNAINQNILHQITVNNSFFVIHVDSDSYVVKGHLDCNDKAVYVYTIDDGKLTAPGTVEWQAGKWENTIVLNPYNSSAN